MRVLFVGDLAPTGFGSVTTDLGRELLKLDLDVRFISQNDLGVLPEPFFSRTLSMPSLITTIDRMTGEEGVEAANPLGSLFAEVNRSELTNGEPWGDWRPEACILLGDIGNVRYQLATTPDFTSVPCYHYCPVEGRGLTPLLREDIWSVAQPVAMSAFGADEIAKVTGVRPAVIYHGVDTTTFHPIKPSKPIVLTPTEGNTLRLTTRDECKRLWAGWFASKLPVRRDGERQTIPSKWMLRTDRHMPRKLYNPMLRALVPVLGEHPDAVLIIHCNATDQGGSLPDTVAKLPGAHRVSGSELGKPEGWGLFDRPWTQIVLTNTSGISREALASLYNAADLYVSTSAEGFGLTIAEALACGVPAVGLDYSAVPEVIGPAGVLVPGYEFDNQYDHFWAAPDEQRFAEAVSALLNDPNQREVLGRKGPRHVFHNFQWSTAARQFADLLSQGVSVQAEAA